MLVYRLEDQDGKGIYVSGVWAKCIGDSSECRVHPMPERDGIGFVPNENYIFGFTSKEQYTAWVWNAEWKRILADNNILLNIYDVDKEHVVVGNSQCVFHVQHAKLTQTLLPYEV